ncbi:hypothetical protein B0T18DRAFT_360362 [Schizothecium vesticola]|uniref:Uncharacterized protein n=1 Tax=Schizothecium vesticola TaxID=314040 RepID=A0AA40KDG6_9PEZI|nr:hypothetical protein B0T18DRAFT_360362 [Schizothecium vesticola]
MCGHEHTPSPSPRVGACVNFFSQDHGHLGNLVFHNPQTPTSPLATHAQFSSTDGLELQDDLLVSIHLSGDLTKPVAECGLFQQFSLSRRGGPEIVLDEYLTLNVSDDGIIGRRVSMTRDGEFVADGIVGFNTASLVAASS